MKGSERGECTYVGRTSNVYMYVFVPPSFQTVIPMANTYTKYTIPTHMI